HPQESRARVVEADVGEAQLTLIREHGERHEERRARRIRRYGHVRCLQALRRRDRNGVLLLSHVDAARLEHALRVIAGAVWLRDAGTDARDQRREEDRALDLRAGDRGRVVDAVELRALDGHRQAAVRRELDTRSHCRERLRHPPHGSLAETRVADERGGETRAGDDTRQQSRGGSAIAAIERLARRGERTGGAFDPHLRRDRRNARADGPQRGGGGLNVRRVENVVDARAPLRQRGEDERAVRDGLVARHADRPVHAKRPRRSGCQRSHPSSAAAMSVLSSRYFTITGVWSASPFALPQSADTARAPGTTTAFSGISRGTSVDPRSTRSLTRS